MLPSSSSTPLVSVSKSTRRGGDSVSSDQPASPSWALPLVCTRTFSTVTHTWSYPQAGASVIATRKVPGASAPPPPPPHAATPAATIAHHAPIPTHCSLLSTICLSCSEFRSADGVTYGRASG